MFNTKARGLLWIVCTTILSVASGFAPAEAQSHRVSESFVWVPNDKTLAQWHMSRAAYNKAHAKEALMFEKAWAAKGTSADSPVYANIRKDCAPLSKKKKG